MAKKHTDIIAEVGLIHDGSIGQAKALIDAAIDAGADVVKFQTHIPSAETLPEAPTPPYFDDEERFEYFERTSFEKAEYSELREYTEKSGAEFLSSSFSIESVELLEDVGVSRHKIPSGEVTNHPYLEAIAQTGKPVLLSTGMSSWDEINSAIELLRANDCGEVTLMQCTSKYPCPPEDAGLNMLEKYKDRFDVRLGFSDHTMGTAIPVAAVVQGAEVIEKHFTLSKQMYGSDPQHSLTPKEFREFVKDIREIETALSNPVDKNRVAKELKNMKETFEKSIVADRDIPEGKQIKIEDLAFKKPGNGILAKEYKSVLGKKPTTNIDKNKKLTWADLVE